MGRRTTRPTGTRNERKHPSLFFFIALAIGLLLLLWLFVHSLKQPPQKLGAVSGQFVNRISAGT